MRLRFPLGGLLIASFLVAPEARAASRTFKATLVEVAGCALASPSGSATLTIDDQSGAVTGTLVLAGFETAVVSSSGIHNAAAGDNLVGEFAGVAENAPNATHAVTTTLNAIALPKILAGDGAVIVKASGTTGCTAGAVRGPLVEASTPGDGEVDAGGEPVDGGAGGPVTAPKDGGGGGASSGGSPEGAAPSADDGGCAQGPDRSFSLASALTAVIALGFVRISRRTRRRS